MFLEIITGSVLKWNAGKCQALSGIRPLVSFRRKPIRRTAESGMTTAFAERTSDWIPRSSRGMTHEIGGMTVFGGRVAELGFESTVGVGVLAESTG